MFSVEGLVNLNMPFKPLLNKIIQHTPFASKWNLFICRVVASWDSNTDKKNSTVRLTQFLNVLLVESYRNRISDEITFSDIRLAIHQSP